MGKALKIALAVVLVLIGVQIALALVVQAVLSGGGMATQTVTYQGGSGSFVGQLEAGEIRAVTINTADQTLTVTPKTGKVYTVTYPNLVSVERLVSGYPVDLIVKSPGTTPWLTSLAFLLPLAVFVLLVVIAVLLVRNLLARRQDWQRQRAELEERIARLEERERLRG